MLTQEINKKGGGPHTTFRNRGGEQKSTPLGLYILLRKAMQRNCTTILRNTNKMFRNLETYKKVK